MKRKTVVLEKVGHSPTLNTVLMVEEAISKAGEPIRMAELKRRLPRKVMHSTLLQVLDYLQESGKILFGVKGIVWVFAPRAEIRTMKTRGLESK